jgi:hypothetical protein
MSSNMGAKRDNGRGSFVQSVITAGESFYREVLQNLRGWKAAPPKLKDVAEGADVPSSPEVLSEVLDVPENAIDEERAAADLRGVTREDPSGNGDRSDAHVRET